MGKGRDKKKKKNRSPKAPKDSKRRRKNDSSDSEDLELIIETLKRSQPQDPTKVSIETVESNDIEARINCAVQGCSEGILIFGGEWTDGSTTRFYGDLLRYNVPKNQWKVVITGMAPTPRSSVQSVVMGNYMYVFGGEFGSSKGSSFVQFKELWRLDLGTFSWEHLQPIVDEGSTGDSNLPWPCARSGHRMTTKQGKIYLFGGFKSSGKEITYLDDFWCYDDFKWSKLSGGPSARSGFQMHAMGDAIYLHGGYSMVQGKKSFTTKVFADMWTYKDNRWEQVRAPLNAPPRSGASSFVYKDRLYVFGGIIDTETADGFLCGQCLNEMHEYNAERGSWKKVELSGDVIHPRYNAVVAVIGSKAYIMSGLFEVGDTSVVLDDMHAINMNTMEAKSIKALTVAFPKPVYEEEEEEYSEEGSEDDSDESYSTSSSSSDGDMLEEGTHPRPLEGQSLKDYFASTADYWQSRTNSSSEAKAMRGEAFRLAQTHFAACSLAGMEISGSDQ